MLQDVVPASSLFIASFLFFLCIAQKRSTVVDYSRHDYDLCLSEEEKGAVLCVSVDKKQDSMKGMKSFCCIPEPQNTGWTQ